MSRWMWAFLLGCVVGAGAQAQTLTTYRFAGGPVTTFATNPTDWIVITGSSTKNVTINKMSICGTATSAATVDVLFLKRSTADSGGTSVPDTAVNAPANNINPTATVSVYTVNPTTLGTLVAQFDVKKLNLGPPSGNAGCILLNYGESGAIPIQLKGTGQQATINFNGSAMPIGLSIDWMIELTEQ